MRKFEKISFEQFKKDVVDDIDLYNNYLLPTRSTKTSAGYDFTILEGIVIKPKEIIKIATGIKASMNDDEVLLLIIRSSLGFKYNLRMCNQVGVIDSDYYNNPDNEGHIFIKIQNEGENDIILEKGSRIVQGIFIKYLILDQEKEIKVQRIGGIGSTNL